VLFDPIENLGETRPPGDSREFACDVLLQGLTFSFGSLLERCVHVVWKITDK
jgi:hypothetical protein